MASSSAESAPPPPISSPQPSAPASSSTTRPLSFRSQLHMFGQRAKVGGPVYQTVNKGTQHDPRFRSTVSMDGKSYTTQFTYSRRRVAEEEAARLAVESLAGFITDEARSLLGEIFSLCKSIVNEYATKLSLALPTYNTLQQEGAVPSFTSSLVFNGSTYVGEAAKTKKDADQLAACAFILSNLGNSGPGTMLFHIIKAKHNAIKRYDLQPIYASGVSRSPIANPGHTSDTPDHKDMEVAGPVSHRKVAEEEAARLAVDNLTRNITDEGHFLLGEIFSLCKAIVNEYAVKLNLQIPTYNTVQQEGQLPTFICSLVFDGSTYVGEAAKTKKAAEQLAARAVILSNLGNSGSETMLFQMIKEKYNAIKRNDSQPIYVTGVSPPPIENPGHTSDKEVAGSVVESSRLLSSCHELQVPAMSLQPGLTLPINSGLCSKKRRMNEEKANQKPRLESL